MADLQIFQVEALVTGIRDTVVNLKKEGKKLIFLQ